MVIDPGVGSTRKAVVIQSKHGQFFVLPDNGLITLVADRDGLEAAREITNPDWMIGKALSSTFHGRDIFSPAGAHVARGDDWTQVGRAMDVKSLVRLDLQVSRLDAQGLHGEIIATDGPFGNLVTNLDAEDFLKLGGQISSGHYIAFAEFFAWYYNSIANGVADALVAERRVTPPEKLYTYAVKAPL